MAFTGDGFRLVGDDGLLYRAVWGAVTLGNGIAPLPVGIYLVLATAGGGFPPPTTGDAVAAGDFIDVELGTSIIPGVGDVVVALTTTITGDISEFGFKFSAQEIDVSLLQDELKKYRKGKGDMTGNMKGIFVVGTTESQDGFLRQFIKIIRQDGDTSLDVYDKQDTIMIGVFYVNSKVAMGDKMAVIAPFQLFGCDVGGAMGQPQSFGGNFRFAPLNYDDGIYNIAVNPTFCRWGTPTTT
jgi:hypothetical protein